jgi:hypothetical protein
MVVPAAIGLLIALAVATAPPGAGAGPDLESLLEAGREARARGALGDVSGRIYDEPARRNAEARPRASVPIVLLPLHGARAAEFEGLKADARRSIDRYRAIAAEIDSLQQRYEAAIRSAGGEDLMQRAITDEGGGFRFDRVPAGEWFLVARLEVPPQISRPRAVPKTAVQRFSGNLEHHGHGAVVYWWRTIEVRAGESTTLELTDRNAGLTVTKENLRSPAWTPEPFLKDR